MIPDWETNCVLVADLLTSRHPAVAQELKGILTTQGVALKEVRDCQDIWIRDAAPVQASTDDFVQFRYWPDYLRGSHEHLVTGPSTFCGLPFLKKVKRSRLIIDGGNIVGTTRTAILTEKVFAENPQRNRSEVEIELRRLLQVERLIFIPKEPYDAIGHSDGMVRFIDEETVVLNDYSGIYPGLSDRLTSSLKRHGLQVALLPYQPEQQKTDGIDSAAGNYVNFLRVGSVFIVPSYGTPADAEGILRLQRLCPQAVVTSIPSLHLAREGGVLQCVTWTIRVPENVRTTSARRPSLGRPKKSDKRPRRL